MGFFPFPVLGRALRRGFGIGGGNRPTPLLLDQFITPRAAGAINGTPAEPTGQNRTVTDTNGKLTITNDKLVFSTGGVGAGDPGVWYPPMTTVVGMAIIGILDPTGSVPNIGVGFDTAATGSIQDCVRLIGGSLVNVIFGGANVSLASYSVSSVYKLCTLQGLLGYYFFIKGGTEFPTWEFIWKGSVGAPGSRLPAVGVQSSTAGIGTIDYMDVPSILYIPKPLAYDTFTRADGALGSTEVVGPDLQVVSALVWNYTAGKWAIVSNVIVATPTQGADVVVNGGFGADTDWSKGTNWTIGGGTANAAAATSNLLATVPPLAVGTWYQMVWTLSAFAAGTVRIRAGSVTSLPTHAANGTYTETQRADTTANLLFVGNGFTGSVDNVSAKALTLKDLFASVQVSTADVIMDVAVTLENASSGKQAGLVLNLDNPSAPANFIIVYLDGSSNIVVDECVAGSFTNKLVPTVIAYGAGNVLRVIRRGTECRVFYNGAVVGGALTMTANVNLNHGGFSTSPLNSLDAINIMAKGTSGEYEAALNALLAA